MSQSSIKPNSGYDSLRGRNNSRPFTVSRHFQHGFIVPEMTRNLFKSPPGYQTIINKFAVMMNFGPFGFTNFIRAGLRANGKMMDGQTDASFTSTEDGFADGTTQLKSNGLICVSWLNGINDYNFYSRVAPNQQVSCIVSLFDPAIDPFGGSVEGVIFVAGEHLAA
jgi:hypothetical protein